MLRFISGTPLALDFRLTLGQNSRQAFLAEKPHMSTSYSKENICAEAACGAGGGVSLAGLANRGAVTATFWTIPAMIVVKFRLVRFFQVIGQFVHEVRARSVCALCQQ